eukprot:scaffold66_cov233-Pinguiococcus_pyrenoidosus.AAC.8
MRLRSQQRRGSTGRRASLVPGAKPPPVPGMAHSAVPAEFVSPLSDASASTRSGGARRNVSVVTSPCMEDPVPAEAWLGWEKAAGRDQAVLVD